jgi:hypothetical protein
VKLKASNHNKTKELSLIFITWETRVGSSDLEGNASNFADFGCMVTKSAATTMPCGGAMGESRRKFLTVTSVGLVGAAVAHGV